MSNTKRIPNATFPAVKYLLSKAWKKRTPAAHGESGWKCPVTGYLHDRGTALTLQFERDKQKPAS